jgi:hypothetical protein
MNTLAYTLLSIPGSLVFLFQFSRSSGSPLVKNLPIYKYSGLEILTLLMRNYSYRYSPGFSPGSLALRHLKYAPITKFEHKCKSFAA